MKAPVHVIATGARTPLGLDAASSAAAVRASISSCAEHPTLVDQAGEPLTASLDALLEPDLPCRTRMVAMAQTALRDACLPLARTPAGLAVPLLLGLPEPRPGFAEADAHWVRERVAQTADLPVAFASVRACMSGHSAVLYLLDLARQEMVEGRYDICLVGGVDSYFQPDTVAWLDRNRQLVGSVSRSGFVPGEGAAFCLLMTPAALQRTGLSSQGLITGSACAWERRLIKTQDINLGEGLTQSVRGAIAGLQPPRERIQGIYCDINGERYRGEEWGFVCLKLASWFEDPTHYCSPADCWGDMGAASGGLLMTLALQAAQRGYASGRRNLAWTSSESGLRAAVLLEADILPSPYRE